MAMRLRETFSKMPGFSLKNIIFQQQGLPRESAFEKTYMSIRDKEQRVYPDNVVRSLPEVGKSHPHKKEWDARKFSLQRLMSYLRRSTIGKEPLILEIGCGNGWLCGHLATLPKSEVLGLDINEEELTQAARVFVDRGNVCFACADIFTANLPTHFFDYIILAASFQYFSDPKKLLHRLLTLLSDHGEIHIVDSPLYRQRDVRAAEKRSQKYFKSMDSNLGDYYHHHIWGSLERFDVKVLFNAESMASKIIRLFRPVSPFPWLRITNARERVTDNAIS